MLAMAIVWRAKYTRARNFEKTRREEAPKIRPKLQESPSPKVETTRSLDGMRLQLYGSGYFSSAKKDKELEQRRYDRKILIDSKK